MFRVEKVRRGEPSKHLVRMIGERDQAADAILFGGVVGPIIFS